MDAPSSNSPPIDPFEREAWLNEILSLQEGAALRKVSVDTILCQHHRGETELVKRSTRLWGIRRRVAMLIPGWILAILTPLLSWTFW